VANDETKGDFSTQMQRGEQQVREQIRGAIDNYFGFLRQSIAAMPSGGSGLGDKMKALADDNIAATHQFFTEISRAKDLEN
jgi:hypothetical protein